MNKDKIIIFSAPSGSGKSTLIKWLMSKTDMLEFSISATSRAPRGTEQNGVEYYSLRPRNSGRKLPTTNFLSMRRFIQTNSMAL